jgi:hypothetical protein
MEAAGVGTIHVVPIDDLVEHELSGLECVCGPDAELLDSGDWLVSHHSLDGREQYEPEL